MPYLPEHIHISAPAINAPGVQETPIHELKRLKGLRSQVRVLILYSKAYLRLCSSLVASTR